MSEDEEFGASKKKTSVLMDGTETMKIEVRRRLPVCGKCGQ